MNLNRSTLVSIEYKDDPTITIARTDRRIALFEVTKHYRMRRLTVSSRRRLFKVLESGLEKGHAYAWTADCRALFCTLTWKFTGESDEA